MSIASRLIEEAERIGPGCQWFEETVGAHPVFFGTLPFAPTHIVRPKRMLSGTTSDMLPAFGIGPGHDHAELLFHTPSGSLLGYSLFEKSPSANAMLIGSTGSGKSTLACGIILGMSAGTSSEAPGSFVIDVGNSFKRTIEYLGGSSVDLSPEKGTVINPFDLSEGQKVPDPEKVKFLTALFEEILGESGHLNKLEKSILESALLEFYEEIPERTISNFYRFLTKSSEPIRKKMATLLTPWCKPHPFGLLFDGTTNVDLRAKHLHFELKGCQRYPDLLRAAMLIVMDSIWREVRGRFPKRSLIIVDECHTVIRRSADGIANSSARWVEDCFRQMRKFSSAAIAISQTASDLKNDEIGDGIIANAPNRFILRQRGDEKALKEALKLNDKELHDVFALKQVRGTYSEFYLQCESVRGVFLYRPTPLELWLSTTHPPDIALIHKTQAEHPNWTLMDLMKYLSSNYPDGAEGGYHADTAS